RPVLRAVDRARPGRVPVPAAGPRRTGRSAELTGPHTRPRPVPCTGRDRRRGDGARWSCAAPGLRQGVVDRGDQFGGARLGARTETAQNLAVGGDQELLEVPLDVPGLAVGVGGLRQLLVDRVPVLTVDL